MTRRNLAHLFVAGAVLAVGTLVGVTIGISAHAATETPRAHPVGVHLPPCDDDAPGKPITGPCWLIDDDGPGRQTRISVWPYPYAPQPWYVLDGSQP